MPEERFWKTTPRKLVALAEVHAEANRVRDTEDSPPLSEVKPRVFIDQLL